MKFNIYSDSDTYWKTLMNEVATDFPRRIALSGGSSADILDHVFEEGVRREILGDSDWKFFQVDERYVPADHEDSNQKLLRSKMSCHSEAYKDEESFKMQEERSLDCTRDDRFVFFDSSVPVEEGIQDYEDSLEMDADGYLFDLLILGVGGDGHVASLFPSEKDEEKLKNSKTQKLKNEEFYLHISDNGLVAHTQTTEFAVLDRMTLTYEAIEKSRKILILMWGEKKQRILNMMESGGDLPVHQILEMEQASVWFALF